MTDKLKKLIHTSFEAKRREIKAKLDALPEGTTVVEMQVILNDLDEIDSIIKVSYMGFNQQLAESHLNKLLKLYKITVKQWSKSSCGRAWPSKHEIKIPHPTDVDRFCVCMHEIKHVIDGRWGKLYEREYACEMFAINAAELLGFDVTTYRERARRYIIMNIAKGYCRGLSLGNISSEIKRFCQIDFKEWEGNSVYVQNWGENTYRGLGLEIKLTPKPVYNLQIN